MSRSVHGPTGLLHVVRQRLARSDAEENDPVQPALVWVLGEVDAAASPSILSGLHAILDGEAPGSLVLDLSRVTFLDLAGLRMLLEVRGRLERDGHLLALRAVPRSAQTLLHLTGCDAAFAYEEDPDPASVPPTGVCPSAQASQRPRGLR